MAKTYKLTNISGQTAGQGPGRMLDHPVVGMIGVGKNKPVTLPNGLGSLEEKWVLHRDGHIVAGDLDGAA